MILRTMALAAAMACSMGTAALAALPPGIPDGWRDAFAYVNGSRLHYYRAVPNPGKPVIVMVHGVTDNGLTWTTLTRDLQGAYDIYMLDTRGHGLSDPFNDANDGDTLVKDVVGFVEAMKFTKPILIGHSMGAATVMRLGAQHPDLARAIVMLDPGLPRAPAATPAANATPRPATPPTPAAATPAPRRVGSVNMFGSPEVLVAQNNDPYEELVAACGRSQQMWDPVDCQYWALSKKQYHGPYTPAQMGAMRGVMNTGDALARITAPALILKADATAEVKAADLQATSVMKTGRLIHIEGSRHNLHHDKRARTVELLNDFLGKLPAS